MYFTPFMETKWRQFANAWRQNKGQAPIKLNEWNRKRGNDRNVIPFHNIRFIFGYIVVF